MMEFTKILVAFGAGLLSFFSPCILPLVPAYICFITGLSAEELFDLQTKKEIKPILIEAFLFILGFSAVFIALGASATFLGSYLLAKQKIFRIIGGAVIILFGLHLIGLFNIRLLQYEKKIPLNRKPIHMLGSFLIGLAFGFGWIPCVGPILAGILMLAATRETLNKGILLLSFYSLGLAIPFLLASLGIRWIVTLFTKIKKYLRLISVISGILLIIIGIGIIHSNGQIGEYTNQLRKAPDFTLPSLTGETLSLSDFKGKIIILDFWATWCPPCVKEIPDFVNLYNKYKDKDLVIIGVSLDSTGIDRVKDFCESMNITYPVVMGNDSVTQEYGGIRGIPTTFIIDRDGTIVNKFVGYTPPEVFETQIKKLF